MKALGLEGTCHFLDDFLCVSVSDLDQANKDFLLVLWVFHELGISISAKKLEEPTIELEFLGRLINTRDFTISLPEDKLQRYREEIASYLHKRELSYQQLDSLVGKLIHASFAIPHGRTFYQRLLRLKRQSRNERAPIQLSTGAVADLAWWHHFIQAWNG
jgi:hypothetical protein